DQASQKLASGVSVSVTLIMTNRWRTPPDPARHFRRSARTREITGATPLLKGGEPRPHTAWQGV
ncbi:MAG: hypothetical protein OXE84_06350, partial [Rhodobacteraceae bacterium]|nr:hypothetical protein [Paracoccaceae bacterium]